MADEHEQRARETDRLFQGLPSHGEVFDSLDDIGSLEPPAPVAVTPPPRAERPADLPAPAPAPTAAPAAVVAPASAPSTAPGVDEGSSRDDSSPSDDPPAPVEPARSGPRTRTDRPAPLAASRPPAPPWRARAITVIAAILVIAGAFLVIFPFDVTDGGLTARCGPPVFEVLVPSDAAFDVPENTLCGPPAQHRLAVGALALAAFVGLAVVHQWSVRARRRRARKARRHAARARRHGTAAPSSGDRTARVPEREPPDRAPGTLDRQGDASPEPVPH